MKKTPGDIIILHMCTKNYNQMMYGSWDMVRHGRTDKWTNGKSDTYRWVPHLKTYKGSFIYLVVSVLYSLYIICMHKKHTFQVSSSFQFALCAVLYSLYIFCMYVGIWCTFFLYSVSYEILICTIFVYSIYTKLGFCMIFVYILYSFCVFFW